LTKKYNLKNENWKQFIIHSNIPEKNEICKQKLMGWDGINYPKIWPVESYLKSESDIICDNCLFLHFVSVASLKIEIHRSKHRIVKQKVRCFKWCLRFQNPTVLGTLKLYKQTRSFKHHELLIYWLMIIDLKRSIDLKRLFDQVLSLSLTWPRYYLLPINQFLIFCYCGYKWWTSENVRAGWQNQPQVL